MEEKELREYLMGNGAADLDTYNKNYLIEAGAGAGKTYTMVGRIINQLLKTEMKPENMVAITFTEKATQEMISRIDKVLAEKLKEATDSIEKEKIQKLSENIDKMNISTIHSFCHKMLSLMPFASSLGPDFEVYDDHVEWARDFFREKTKDDSLFQEARDYGVSYSNLEDTFLSLCEIKGEIAYQEMNKEDIHKKYENMKLNSEKIYQRMITEGNWDNVINRKGNKKSQDNLAEMKIRADKFFEMLEDSSLDFFKVLLNYINPAIIDDKVVDIDLLARLLPGTKKKNEEELKVYWSAIKNDIAAIIHSIVMKDMNEICGMYRSEKKKNKIATQADLLYYARDMLRDNKEAREYFHNRFQCFYVDEMQDTDPVQAQILFYLTTSEENFNRDWQKCLPLPGRLFLVGDPKQAIYRFRGADISVYKTLWHLFGSNGIGETVKLHFNYRSAEEICDFIDKVFSDKLIGGEMQAEYSKMESKKGSSQYAKIVSYLATDDEPELIARYIKKQVQDGTLVGGLEDKGRAAEYGDFMILTRTKKKTADYVAALNKYDIPSSLAGEKSFLGNIPIFKARVILQFLLEPRDEVYLTAVLAQCYRIPLPVLRKYREKVGRIDLLSFNLADDFTKIKKALIELHELWLDTKKMPAMTIVEKIFYQLSCVWQDEKNVVRQEEYALVVQYLNLLRKHEDKSFSMLAKMAVNLSNEKVKKQLLLEEKDNCVRVMNLHQAKGLEAEVIILAMDSKFRDITDKHVEYLSDNNVIHACLKRSNWGGNGFTEFGWEEEWESVFKPREKGFLRAEIDRLLYVAATRAKTQLIVCGGKAGKNAASAWSELAKKCTLDEALLDADNLILKDDKQEEIQEHVIGDKDVLPEVTVDIGELKKDLDEKVESLTKKSILSVVPSNLDYNEELGEDSVSKKIRENNYNRPHGTIWGKIIHRLLELVVQKKAWQKGELGDLAEQAVYEIIGKDDVSDNDKRDLVGEKSITDHDELCTYLVDEAISAVEFIKQEENDLRRLLETSEAYPEMYFALQENDTKSNLFNLVNSFISNAEANPIFLNGVIDLALKKDEGWVIIDYKTDIVLPEESEMAYRNRLQKLYARQLLIYKEVLGKITGQKVSHVYICAINLGGKLLAI